MSREAAARAALADVGCGEPGRDGEARKDVDASRKPVGSRSSCTGVKAGADGIGALRSNRGDVRNGARGSVGLKAETEGGGRGCAGRAPTGEKAAPLPRGTGAGVSGAEATGEGARRCE